MNDWQPPAKGYFTGKSWMETEYSTIEILHKLRHQETTLRDCQKEDDNMPRFRIYQYGNCLGYATLEAVQEVLHYFQLSGFLDDVP